MIFKMNFSEFDNRIPLTEDSKKLQLSRIRSIRKHHLLILSIISFCFSASITEPIQSQNQNKQDSALLNKQDTSPWGPDFTLEQIISPVDSVIQNAYFYRYRSTEKKPLIVQLHS